MSKRIMCRCEDVTYAEYRAAFAEGFTELESLKRYTGVGTGFCQGKGCLVEAALELSVLRGVPPGEIRLTNIRPPVEPVTFADLAALEPPSLIGDLERARAAAAPPPDDEEGGS